MIQVNDLWKNFGRHDALRGLSFSVPPEQRVRVDRCKWRRQDHDYQGADEHSFADARLGDGFGS